MRHIYLLFAALVLLNQTAHAQTKAVLGGGPTSRAINPTFSKTKDGTTKALEEDRALVSGKAYASIVGDRFSYLVTGDKEFAALGNFASINPATATATVAFGSILHGKKNEYGNIGYISGSATGGADQNIVSLFSADKFNTNFEARATYSLIASRLGTKFFFEKEEWEKQQRARANAASALEAQRYRYLLKKSQNAAEAKALEVIEKSVEYKTAFNKPNADKTAEDLQLLFTYQNRRTKLNSASQKEITNAELFESDTDYNKALEDTIYTIEKKAAWSSIKLGWLDFFAASKLQKINLYDGTAKYFAHRLTESRETYNKVGLAYNISWFSEEYYTAANGILRFELAYSKSNNAADLIPFDVSTEQKLDSANVSRKSTKKVNSYEKSEFVISDYVDFRIDILKEVTKNHRAYLRVIYNYSQPVNQKVEEGKIKVPNTHNLTLGYLLSFNGKNKEKSVVNFQPYIKFKDLGNEYKQDLSLLRRSEIGILTTFPLGLSTPKD